MKSFLVCAAVMALLCGASMAAPAAGPVKALVVTGGHGFDAAPFEAMFKDMKDVAVTFHTLKDDSEIFEDISKWDYDVVVFYHMTQKISEKRKANFLALLDKGVGVVLLHHAIAAYNDWPEYWKIAGTRYFLDDVKEGGKTLPKSTYAHDIDFKVTPADPDHPVTKGIAEFTVHDETYKGYNMEPGLHMLLTTDHETAQKEIGWCHDYKNARVCLIQPGHGPQAFAQPEYRQLVQQAILWTAKR